MNPGRTRLREHEPLPFLGKLVAQSISLGFARAAAEGRVEEPPQAKRATASVHARARELERQHGDSRGQ